MHPQYCNRLKNGVSEKDFYISKSSDILLLPQFFTLSEEMITDKQKEQALRIMYGPEVFTIKADENGKPVLKNISEQICEVPRTIGSYKKGNISVITIKGFMLCIDKELRDKINSSKNEQEKKEAIKAISKIVKEFSEVNSRNPLLTAIHELKHNYNDIRLEEIAAEDGGLKLTPEQLAITRVADECSASAAELLHLADEYKKNSDIKVFPKDFQPFAEELQKMSPEKQKEALNNPAYLVNKAIELWQKNPRNESYLGEKGDFTGQLNSYAEKVNPNHVDPNNSQFSKIMSAYFTFNINGKEVDLSSQLNQKISAPKHIYQDAEETIKKRRTASAAVQKYAAEELKNRR